MNKVGLLYSVIIFEGGEIIKKELKTSSRRRRHDVIKFSRPPTACYSTCSSVSPLPSSPPSACEVSSRSVVH